MFSEITKECLDLRQTIKLKDGLISQYFKELSSRDVVIQELKQVCLHTHSNIKKLKAYENPGQDTFNLGSGRNNYFSGPGLLEKSSRSSESLNDSFYSLQLKGTDKPFLGIREEKSFLNLPRVNSASSDMYWGSGKEVCAILFDSKSMVKNSSEPDLASIEYVRQIWSPISTAPASKAPQKSASNSNLSVLYDTGLETSTINPLVGTPFSSAAFNEAKDLKQTFKVKALF